MNPKYDTKKALKELNAPKNTTFELLEVPTQRFLSIEGIGSPQFDAFSRAIETLYSVAYPLKFISKARTGLDYVVGPLEALWWADDYRVFTSNERNSWRWRLLTALPEAVSVEDLEAAQAKALSKGFLQTSETVFHALNEGLSYQALYIGPFSEEEPALKNLHSVVMPEASRAFNGLHHENNLSDMRKTVPSLQKTVLRQPVIQK